MLKNKLFVVFAVNKNLEKFNLMAANNEVRLQIVKNVLACVNCSRELQKYVIYYFVNSVEGSISDFLTLIKIVLFGVGYFLRFSLK